MVTCTEAKWDVDHGRFYCVVRFPSPCDVTVRDVVMRTQSDDVVIEPPACLVWSAEMAAEGRKAITKYLRLKCTGRSWSRADDVSAAEDLCGAE